jgi:hypothetical protein
MEVRYKGGETDFSIGEMIGNGTLGACKIIAVVKENL